MSYICYLSLRRFATSASFRRSPSQAPRQFRHFTTTVRRADDKAKPDMMAVIQELRETKLFKEISNNEELMVSIQEAVLVLQEEGFDPNKSNMMMFVTNTRVREKMTRVMTAVQAAGIDPATAKEAFDLVKSRVKSG